MTRLDDFVITLRPNSIIPIKHSGKFNRGMWIDIDGTIHMLLHPTRESLALAFLREDLVGVYNDGCMSDSAKICVPSQLPSAEIHYTKLKAYRRFQTTVFGKHRLISVGCFSTEHKLTLTHRPTDQQVVALREVFRSSGFYHSQKPVLINDHPIDFSKVWDWLQTLQS